jgi:Cu2+-exporting ATPase
VLTSPPQAPGFTREGRCLHCKSAIPEGAKSAKFCCNGCEAVHQLLVDQGLDRYYALAGSEVAPAPAPAQGRSQSWLEPLLEASEARGGEVCSLQLDVQGIHCAACVWLMNETYRRQAGAASAITINSALGSVALSWRKGQFDVARWVKAIEAFGYQFGPARKKSTRRSLDLPMRLGISFALTMNVMLFSLSFYFGLTQDDPEVFRLFTWLSFGLSTITVGVGGWPFFQAAVRGLRAGMLHLDLPIAMGILLVYGMSAVQLVTSHLRGDLAYFDTLNTFITLMLLGRFAQERMLDRNRRFLLEDDGAEGLLVRKVVGERLVSIPTPKVEAGDVLLVAPGDLVPVEALLLEGPASVSTDWITGEAAPREVQAGQSVPAGSFNAGRVAFHVRASTPFADSPLVTLLRAPPPREGRPGRHQALWTALARRWVVTVVAVSAAGLLLWLPKGIEPAINVAVSLLVITCPCAIGLALPLAYELTASRLRRAGFFVRSVDLLDRLAEVRQLVFDKTGTLTLGRLELAGPVELSPELQDLAWNLAVRSRHPVSTAVARALEGQARYDVQATVEEVPGKGVEWRRPDGSWRLGRADWAVPGATERETVLSRDGQLVARFPTREALRADAKVELERLTGAGYLLWLLSGDAPARVAAMAATLTIPPERALGGLQPQEKADAVQRIGAASVLYLGDGVNDALAFEQALVAGTPAIDRPVMPSRSDFFLVGEGLAPLHQALAWSLHLRGVVRTVLTLSIAYNLVAITASLLGFMSPLAAAISMPASTFSLLAVTMIRLRRFDGAPTASLPRAAQISTSGNWSKEVS